MPSRREVDDLSAALRALSTRAKGDLLALWRTLPDPGDLPAVRVALERTWPELIAAYGDMSATVAADVFEAWASDLGIAPEVVMVEPVDMDRANARMRWAIGTPEQVGTLTVILDELVKQPGRSTLAKSAVASGAGWARVPHGPHTCAFCTMLASRGAVYSTARTAGGDGRKFHGECDCAVILVRDSRDFPDGYDPDALFDVYAAAAASSRGTKGTLAEMRKALGTH